MAPSEVAAGVFADPPAIRRLMRALSAVGVVSELANGCFVNTELGHLLCESHPRSARSMAIMRMDDRLWRAWGALPEGVQRGRPLSLGESWSFWDDFADDPVRANQFNALMVVRTNASLAA